MTLMTPMMPMKYARLASVYQELEATSKRLEKTRIIAEFLKEVPETELDRIILLLQGRLFPRWDKRTLGVSSKLAVKALAKATGEPEAKITTSWKKIGDLGGVARELVAKKKQATLVSKELTVKELFETLRKLPEIEGTGSVDRKLASIAALLGAASPEESRYVLRSVLEELRVGVAEGALRDAIVWAFLNPPLDEETGEVSDREAYKELVDAVQGAYDRANDFAEVALAAKEGGVAALKKIKFELGKPIRVMLAQRELSVESALERVGQPCALEYKYDGFRMQVHKKSGKGGLAGGEVTIFTRRLENVTAQFPEVVEAVQKHIEVEECLLDCEAVGYDSETGKYMPFQAISQRIRRKYDIEQLAEKLPVELVIFDLLYVGGGGSDGDREEGAEGKVLLETPFAERRKLLREEVLPKDLPLTIRLSEYLETDSPAEGVRFYKASLAAGNEGIMAKNLEGPYKPGARVGHMVKIKPTMETMDLVIVGAEWGEGKRSGWLTSFTLACFDPIEDEFLTVGRVGTGLKELEASGAGEGDGSGSGAGVGSGAGEGDGSGGDEPTHVTFDRLTKLLQPDILSEDGREVELNPRVVIEIKFEEVQQSPTYGSGFALRFPRVVRLREDRGIEDVTTLDEVKAAFKHQRGR